MRSYAVVWISVCATLAAAIAVSQVANDLDRRMGASAITVDPASGTASPAEMERITALIDSLAEIKEPDYGFAPFMGGVQFAPIKSSSRFNVGVIMIDHGLKTSESLEQLVALGPKALPQLLARLTDQTPTKLTMKHGGGFGVQWFGREVDVADAHPRERSVLQKYRFDLSADGSSEEDASTHHVTIGDVCFVIIGQIVNRSYQSARYQPTACRVINSPTHDPIIAEIVRAIWKDDNPAQRLFDSFQLDLRSEDTEVQCGAAMRLLFYFPDESSGMIARRIRGFVVTRLAPDEDWRVILKKNGVRIDDFLKAVRTIPRPDITDALIHVVNETDDPDILPAAISAAVVEKEPELVFQRMRQVVKVAPTDDGPFGGEYITLLTSAKYFPVRSKELFETYRDHHSIPTLRACIHALQKPAAPQDWMIAFLSQSLDDKRDTGWEYGPNYDRQPIRICDEAADSLAKYYLKNAPFEFKGDHSSLDRQIEKIKQAIAAHATGITLPSEPPIVVPDVPQLSAKHVVQLAGEFGRFYAMSTDDILWAGKGSRGPAGYQWETLKFDPTSGAITDRILIDSWNGGVNLLDHGPAHRLFAYHGYEGGHVLVHDARTGRLLKKIATPFHDLREGDDGWEIRNMGDLALCGPNAEWLIAITENGALHSINTENSEHRIEWTETSAHTGVTRIRGTHKVLLQGIGGKSLFDVPIRIWDQSDRTQRTLGKMPHGGWRDAWGNLAMNHFNSRPTLWNLEKAQELTPPTNKIPIAQIICRHDQTRSFFLRTDGSVDVFKVLDGTALQPILRLLPPETQGRKVSIMLVDDDRRLLWIGQPADRTDDADPPNRARPRPTIAIFDVDVR